MAWIEADPPDDGPAATEVGLAQGIVESIEDGVAIVLIGPDLEEWDFPSHLLPAEAREDTVLRLEWDGETYHVLDIDPSMKPLEERLDRGLNRKRPIVFPLPHRAVSPTEEPRDPDVEIDRRVSRLARGLGH